MVQQERAARTREALLRAAAEAFVDEGFARATLTNISRKAGVSYGALHFHFENKDSLAQAVEAAALDTVRRVTHTVEQRDSALQRLIDATYELMNSIHDDVVVRAGFELLATAPRRKEVLGLRGQWRRWIEGVLHTAQENGELAEGVRPTQASDAIVAATVGFKSLGAQDPKWVSQHTLHQYWELMLPRLAPPHMLPALMPHGTCTGCS